MERKTHRAVLFDFDGTITKPFNWSPMKKEMRLEDGVSILDYISEAPETERARVEGILARHEADATETAELNEGLRQVVNFLEARSVPFGIVTNNTKANVKEVLSRFHIRCGSIISRDMGFWKPDPRPVLEGCRALGFPSSEVVFIGDGKHDMRAGRKSGTLNVGLINRPRNHDGFADLCDHVIHNLSELVGLFESLLTMDRRPARRDSAKPKTDAASRRHLPTGRAALDAPARRAAAVPDLPVVESCREGATPTRRRWPPR